MECQNIRTGLCIRYRGGEKEGEFLCIFEKFSYWSYNDVSNGTYTHKQGGNTDFTNDKGVKEHSFFTYPFFFSLLDSIEIDQEINILIR